LARWIKPGSLVMTDEAKAFDMLDGMHDRHTVNHSEEE
jgi:hypothetical protein